MAQRRSFNLLGRIILTWLALLAARVPAQAASNGESSLSGLALNVVYADLDGDQKPDLAQMHRSFLQLRLSGGTQLQVATTPGNRAPGMEILAADIDNDNDLDIVVRNRLLVQRTSVWINDGKGFFTESSTHSDLVSFGHNFWKPTRTEAAGPAITGKRPNSLVRLVSAGIHPPLSLCTAFRGSLKLRTFLRYDDASRLRSPPTFLSSRS